MPFAPNLLYPDGQPLTGFATQAAAVEPPAPSLDRAIADTGARRKPIGVPGFSVTDNSQFADLKSPALTDNSHVGNAIRAVTGIPADVSRAVTGLLKPNAAVPIPTPSLSVAAQTVAPPVATTAVAPVASPPALRADVTQLLSGNQQGSVGGGFAAQATKATNGEIVAPELPALRPLPRMDFNVGYGENAGGGVFGALARNVNAAADFGDANNARKAAHQRFSDSVAAFDTNTKRLAVTTTADIAKAKNTIDLIKSGKEVQEAQLLQTHRDLLAQYARNPTPEIADQIALVKGHLLPDHIINFGESVINQSPPSAVSTRYGTAITPNKGGGGFTVAAVNGGSGGQPTDKVYTNAQGQRVRIVNGKQVAF